VVLLDMLIALEARESYQSIPERNCLFRSIKHRNLDTFATSKKNRVCDAVNSAKTVSSAERDL
jgi:hypothetical protein